MKEHVEIIYKHGQLFTEEGDFPSMGSTFSAKTLKAVRAVCLVTQSKVCTLSGWGGGHARARRLNKRFI